MNFSCVWTVLSAGLIATGALAAPGPDCSPAVLQELPLRASSPTASLFSPTIHLVVGLLPTVEALIVVLRLPNGLIRATSPAHINLPSYLEIFVD
ncbi:unnamed protein product [Nezara viridula]|uniref:Neuropeptide n=1 Tax=Nezara viridula TaxID=85310 RepID=A0A9P0HI44_NEZVI|nr:unnamed protein product [Nezara viridula]